MWRADIEVPNPIVARNAQIGPACYPRGSFYPISSETTISLQRIILPCFRNCSTCMSISKAPLCQYTHKFHFYRNWGNLWALSLLFRKWPSQSNWPPDTVFYPDNGQSKNQNNIREVLHWRLHQILRPSFTVSLLFSTNITPIQCQASVKLHGVFLSLCG